MLIVISDIPISSKLFRDCRLILAPGLQVGAHRWCRTGEVTIKNQLKPAESERRKITLVWMGLEDQGRYQSQLSEDLEPE